MHDQKKRKKGTGTQMGVLSRGPAPSSPLQAAMRRLHCTHFPWDPRSPSPTFTPVSPSGRSTRHSLLMNTFFLLPGPAQRLLPRENWGASHGLPSPSFASTWPDQDCPPREVSVGLFLPLFLPGGFCLHMSYVPNAVPYTQQVLIKSCPNSMYWTSRALYACIRGSSMILPICGIIQKGHRGTDFSW